MNRVTVKQGTIPTEHSNKVINVFVVSVSISSVNVAIFNEQEELELNC